MISLINYLPHRYPFLLVDRVTSIEEERIEGIKNVSFNEPFFQGHFPDNPVMPGVLMIESLAQLSGVMLVHQLKLQNDNTDKSFDFVLVGVDKARFKKQVKPGDQIELAAKMMKRKQSFYKLETEAKVNGSIVCIAEIMLADVTHI